MDVKATGGLKLNDSPTCYGISLPLKKHILSKIAHTSLKTFFKKTREVEKLIINLDLSVTCQA